MTKLVLQPAYVLHTRPFKETSLICDLLTLEEGRLSVLVKGAKRPKSRLRGIMAPFIALQISAIGRGELLTLTGAESTSYLCLHGAALMSGLYVNELLYKVLAKGDPHPIVFHAYQALLDKLNLTDPSLVQWSLRQFEYCLLQEMGYGLDLTKDANNDLIEAQAFYHYHPDKGFLKVTSDNGPSIMGAALIAFRENDFKHEHLKGFKILMRGALSGMLMGQKIHTRDLARHIGEMS